MTTRPVAFPIAALLILSMAAVPGMAQDSRKQTMSMEGMAADVKAAIKDGAVTTEEPGVLVNLPLVTWPGGRR